MVLPIRPPYSDPIPNNPFYSPEQYAVQGIPGLYIVGSGLSVSADGTLSSTGGGGGAVSGVFAGTGITVSANTGNVIVTNAGVTSLIAGTGISLSGATGAVTINSTTTGTVTSVASGTGLTGGPITGSGTLSLANTGVVAASYTNPTITIDAQGRITAASSGSAIGSIVGTSPVNAVTVGSTTTVSINAATTAQSGAVQLSDSVASTSSTTAATSLAVKTAFDAAAAAIPKACITGKGALVTGTSAGTPVALPAPFFSGQMLYSCSACAEGLVWGPKPVPSNATPGTAGVIQGCTTYNFPAGGITSLGDGSMGDNITTGGSNVAVGDQAAYWMSSGSNNTAIGSLALFSATAAAENNNTAIGSGSGIQAGGSGNTLLGVNTGCQVGCNNVGGDNNTLIGYNAGCNITDGTNNVAVGCGVTVASATGSCQLAIGFALGQYWLTGTSTKAIKPGAGIIDCAGSCGTNGQVLMSNGSNAICWGPIDIANATPLAAGKIVGCTVARPLGIVGLTALGVEALDTLSVAPANPNGSVAIGYKAMKTATGPSNVAVGDCALYGPSSFGGDNTAIGNFALKSAGGASGNVALGANSGCNLTSGNYNVLIGAETQAPVATADCQLVIGSGVGFCWLTGCSTKAIRPAAGIIDSTSSCGTANMVLTSQGNAIQWKSVSSAIAAPNYGSFLSTATQTATGGANVGIPVLLNTTVAANNFSVVSNSRVTAAVGGTYNLQFSIQLQSTAAGGNVEIWLAKNGTAIANSNTRFYLGNSNEAEFAALNFVETLAAGDYLELIWGTDNNNIQLLASSSILTTPGPNIPSVILTIVPVGA